MYTRSLSLYISLSLSGPKYIYLYDLILRAFDRDLTAGEKKRRSRFLSREHSPTRARVNDRRDGSVGRVKALKGFSAPLRSRSRARPRPSKGKAEEGCGGCDDNRARVCSGDGNDKSDWHTEGWMSHPRRSCTTRIDRFAMQRYRSCNADVCREKILWPDVSDIFSESCIERAFTFW